MLVAGCDPEGSVMDAAVSTAAAEAVRCQLLILYSAEAQEWASYLHQILKSSQKFHKKSIWLHAVDPDDPPGGPDLQSFQSCECIVLLLTEVFLDLLGDRRRHAALHRLLQPPHRVVALLCGVSEAHVSTHTFGDWPSWRKVYAEDEPALYVSTVMESVTDSRQATADQKSRAAASRESADPTQDAAPERRGRSVSGDEGPAASRPGCLTVQPGRVLCGAAETLYVILRHKLEDLCSAEVEFSSDKSSRRVSGCVENEYTLSLVAPDMPPGVATLTLHAGTSSVSLTPVTFYTTMGEVSRCLDGASDPISFMCQAFNLTSNATDTLDSMLTDCFKSRMPASGLQLFGIKQIEEDNMSTCQRTEELPTLLHFAARYGLKKLSSVLLRCPGALQAYSVMDRHGHYPNTLAGRSGFTDLRQFMDEFVETADMLKTHLEDGAEVYESMSAASQDLIARFSAASEDIYESMLGIDPECADDLYEVMNAVDNPEEAMLRKFFQVKPLGAPELHAHRGRETAEKEERQEREEGGEAQEEEEEEEDPYNLHPEDIYDTVDPDGTYSPAILNRPPAPIPRPEPASQPEPSATYISRVFSKWPSSAAAHQDLEHPAARPAAEPPPSSYDPYAGMKTPGQRQLISLQERVKVGEITVDEAVQEFKEWQFDHEQRSNSIRYQQENLKKLRDSITRRHKERQKDGKGQDYEISAPLQRNMYWESNVALPCAIYEPAPRMVALPPLEATPPLEAPPPLALIQRGSWKTGSTSSTSSGGSNRLSTHSTVSCSSGAEPDVQDHVETLPSPPRPPRPSDAAPLDLPPRIPPRIPERLPERNYERYTSCPQRPAARQSVSPPPVPRRLR